MENRYEQRVSWPVGTGLAAKRRHGICHPLRKALTQQSFYESSLFRQAARCKRLRMGLDYFNYLSLLRFKFFSQVINKSGRRDGTAESE